LGDRRGGVFSPFLLPEGLLDATDAGGRTGRDFGDVRAQPHVGLYDGGREHADTLRRTAHRAVRGGHRRRSLDRLTSVLRDHGLQPITVVASFGEAESLPQDSVAAVVLGLDRGFVAQGFAVIGEQDILGDRLARPAKAKRKPEQLLAELANYAEGDYVEIGRAHV